MDVSLDWNGQRPLWDRFCSGPSNTPRGSARLRDCFLPHPRCFSKTKMQKQNSLELFMTFPFISTQTGFFLKSTGSSLLAHENSLRNSLTLLRVGDSGRARNTFIFSVDRIYPCTPLHPSPIKTYSQERFWDVSVIYTLGLISMPVFSLFQRWLCFQPRFSDQASTVWGGGKPEEQEAFLVPLK